MLKEFFYDKEKKEGSSRINSLKTQEVQSIGSLQSPNNKEFFGSNDYYLIKQLFERFILIYMFAGA